MFFFSKLLLSGCATLHIEPPRCAVFLQVDLVDQAVMTAEEVEDLARKLGCKLYRTCVKEDINVTEVRKWCNHTKMTDTVLLEGNWFSLAQHGALGVWYS